MEGVQPSIPQNPTTAEARANDLVPKGPGANQSLSALAGNENAAFKPLVKHVLSKELILFFDKIRSAILDEDPDQDVVVLRKSALESVRSDPGLQQLVPYFVNFISEKITHSLNNLFVLQQMMELTRALIENKSHFVSPYVGALAPSILTCLVGRKLGTDADSLKEQYNLRETPAALIGLIANKFTQSGSQTKARMARTCLKYFLDPTRSLLEHYGAINGLRTIGGPEAVLALILPNLKHFEKLLVKAENERGPRDEQLQMLIGAILKSIKSIVDDGGDTMIGVNGNGANGYVEEGRQLEEYLGSVIGGRIVALGNHALNRVILSSRERE